LWRSASDRNFQRAFMSRWLDRRQRPSASRSAACPGSFLPKKASSQAASAALKSAFSAATFASARVGTARSGRSQPISMRKRSTLPSESSAAAQARESGM
jgi:hypothetical protein